MQDNKEVHQAKVQDNLLGKEVYDCKLPWPEESVFLIHNARAEPALKTEPPRYSFIGYIPAPDNIPAKNQYYYNRPELFLPHKTGFQRQKITLVGCGSSFEEAEIKAHEKLNKVETCNHIWYRHPLSGRCNIEETPLLDGDCSCTSDCRIYVPRLQMDDGLRAAMNLAYVAHEGQKRKYSGAPYINHPEAVYNRVAWWNTPLENLNATERLLMAKAAYGHDILEDCPQITKEQFISEVDEETYNLVLELTNPSKGSSASRAERKQMDRDHLAHVSWEAKIIKLFDRIENLKDMDKCPDKKFVALYANESRLLWEILKDADKGLAQELLYLIEALEKS